MFTCQLGDIRKTRNIYIHHSRVPLPEIYSPISGAFPIACADETEVSSVDVMSAPLGGVGMGWIAVLSSPGDLGSWLVFERTTHCVVIPDARFGDNTHDLMQ